MRRRIILIVVPVILILAVVASPALANVPAQPANGELWQTIANLQAQVNSLQAALNNFTEKDPVFSAMDNVTALDAQVGANVLTQGDNISLLNNDAGYVTNALQVGNIKEVRVWPELDVHVGETGHTTFTYNLPAGAIPLSANGQAWLSTGNDYVPLDAGHYSIYPSFFDDGQVHFRCWYEVPLSYLFADALDFYLYYSYIQP